MPLVNKLLFLLTVAVISGCSYLAESPVKQWQLAVQGAFHGALSQDGTKLVLASVHHGGSLWDTTRNARLYNWNHYDDEFTQILTTAISPDGQYALTAEERDLVLWSTQSGKAFWFWTSPDDIYSASLTNDGRFALLGLGNSRAVFFDVRNGGVLRQFRHRAPVRSVALSHDGRIALTGSEDFSAVVWDVNSGELVHQFIHENQVHLVAISPDGSLGLTEATLEPTKIWNLKSGKLITELGNGKQSFVSARFVNNNQHIITGTTNRQVHLWDSFTGKKLTSWRLPKNSDRQYTSASVHDISEAGNKYLAITSDGYLFLLEP